MNMATAQSSQALEDVTGFRLRLLCSGFLFLVVTGLLYAPTVSYLFYDWWHNPDYSHGFFVLPAAAFFLYRKRRVLRDVQVRPSNVGLLVVAGSLAVFVVAYVGAEAFTQRLSLLLLIAGTALYLSGWRTLREITFVLLLLLLAIPLPALIFNSVALPLQLIASSLAEKLLGLCNIPVFREGNLLQLDQVTLNVTEACSGIRSLATLVTAGAMVSYFLPAGWWLRLFFVASSVPVAIGVNALRVAGTGVLGQVWGERYAQGFLHLFSGWIVFVFATSLLLGEWMLLERYFRSRVVKEGGKHP